MIKANWSGESAFNLDLALTESLNWIENVLGVSIIKKDGAIPISEVFLTSLKDGILICKLINQIKAGTVAKINNTTSDAAKRENLSFFIKGAKGLGLRDTQLFDTTDLYESKRIRNVAISLYWLGRAARGISTYKGPQLNLLAFQKMNCSACKTPINDNNYLATLTQQWHTACAKCCQCHCNLDPKKQFFMEGNNIWCPDCMVGATKIGSGNTGNNSGKHGHGHGHKHGGGDNECVGCHGSLEKGYVPETEGSDRKYCTKCICDACHNPLIGNFSIKDGKKICDDCSCSSCGKSLEDGFFEMGISKFCEPCAHKKNEHDSKPKPTVSTATLSNTNSPTSSPNKSTTTTSTNNNNNNNNSNTKDGCKQCHKPIDKKVKKGNDRDKFCEPHEHDKCCGKCDKEIVAQSLQALGKNYHPNCFTCEKCNKKLGPSDTIKKSNQGNPVCGPCSSKGSCHECDKPISGSGVEALDHIYHPECFKCHGCDKKLQDDFQEVDNEAFCVPCAKELSKITNEHGHGHGAPESGSFITSGWGPNDKCVSCVKPLNGMVAKLDNQYWHKGCFHCTDCKSALLSGFYPHNKKPYCKGCYDKNQTSTVCSICTKTILYGSIVKAGTKQYHKECFDKGCTTCKKPLSSGQVYTKFSKPYCGNCFQKDTNCSKCKVAIKGEYYEKDNQIYCPKCQPAPVTSTIYGQRQAGFTVDPRSGKKTFH